MDSELDYQKILNLEVFALSQKGKSLPEKNKEIFLDQIVANELEKLTIDLQNEDPTKTTNEKGKPKSKQDQNKRFENTVQRKRFEQNEESEMSKDKVKQTGKDIEKFGKMMRQVDKYIQTQDPCDTLEGKIQNQSKFF